LKNGVETKIIGKRKNLKILKFNTSLFVFFNIELDKNFKVVIWYAQILSKKLFY